MIRRRDPCELFVLGLCLLSGLSFTLGSEPPSSVEQTLPGWLVTCWYLALLAAGTVGVVGNFWPGQIGTGLLIRIAGQILAASPAAAYAVAVVGFAGWPAAFPAGIIAVFAFFCLWTAKCRTEELHIIRGAR